MHTLGGDVNISILRKVNFVLDWEIAVQSPYNKYVRVVKVLKIAE